MVFLIYDDNCYLCTKFALFSRKLSRGRVEIIGHFTPRGMALKRKVFPEDFDPSTMFWLVKETKAYGARSALMPLAYEILKGILKPSDRDHDESNIEFVCNSEEMTCNTPQDFVRRVSMLIRNGKKINIKN